MMQGSTGSSEFAKEAGDMCHSTTMKRCARPLAAVLRVGIFLHLFFLLSFLFCPSLGLSYQLLLP